MGRMYVAPIEAETIAAAAELFFLESAANKVLVVHEIKVTQDNFTTSEQMPLRIYRTATDQGAKGSAVTVSPLDAGDSAFGGTVRTNILTAATFATPGAILTPESQNLLNGWHILPTPENRIVIPGGGYLVIKLEDAPSESMDFSGYVILEEIG